MMKAMASAPTPPRLTLAMDLDRVEALSADLERIAEASTGAAPLLRDLVAHCKKRVPHYDWVGVYLLEGGELVLGPFAGSAPARPRLPLGHGIAGTAAQSARSVMREGNSGSERGPETSAAELAVPIHDGGRVWGVCAVISAQPHGLNEHDQALLERAASFMAGALERAPSLPQWPQPEAVGA